MSFISNKKIYLHFAFKNPTLYLHLSKVWMHTCVLLISLTTWAASWGNRGGSRISGKGDQMYIGVGGGGVRFANFISFVLNIL